MEIFYLRVKMNKNQLKPKNQGPPSEEKSFEPGEESIQDRFFVFC